MKLISVEETQELIRKHLDQFPHTISPLVESYGKVIQEDLFADRHFPPFHRVSMDGVAISFASWQNKNREFTIEGFQAAGDYPTTLNHEDCCIEVMTGTVLPIGCDCVIRFEDITIKNGCVRIDENLTLKKMQNIHQEGADYLAGDRLACSGELMRAPLFAVAAAVGKEAVCTSISPKIAIISTGDELVPINQTPKSFQIRRSNSYSLLSTLNSCGFTHVFTFHLNDDKQKMVSEVMKILDTFDCLIFTGGVSKGRRDYVPHVLKELGVNEIFHGVRQRPGKPLWFGIGSKKQCVFGLPGNPVSTLVCAHRYVLPALRLAQGKQEENLPYGILTHEFQFDPSLVFFLPVKVGYTRDGRIQATRKKVNGSGDFVSLVGSDGFIELPDKEKRFLKGSAYPIRFWNHIV